MARPKGSGVTPVVERLKRKTEYAPNGCWLWSGHVGHNGYGQIRVEDRSERVHRVAYEALVGPIPYGLNVLHRCDCRRCWNPDHLFAGTNADNTGDMMSKGRNGFRPSKGEANGNARLTEDQVRAIRKDRRALHVIADELGIHFTTVSDVRRRKSWQHVLDHAG